MKKRYTILAILLGMLCFHTEQAAAQIPTIIYVDSAIAASGTGASWASPLKTLSEGLWKAHTITGAVQIWVRKGTYFPMQSPTTIASSLDSSFIIRRNNLKIYGGFAGTEATISERIPGTNNTILSGDLGAPEFVSDNTLHVMKIITYPVKLIDSSTLLDGLTITGGNANGRVLDTYINVDGNYYLISSGYGAGLYIFCIGSPYSCAPSINNCRFLKNTASGPGGAVWTQETNVSFRHCNFADNTGYWGGAICFQNYTSEVNALILESNTFSRNTAIDGGAVAVLTYESYCYASNNIFEKNSASYGSGGALFLSSGRGADTLINNLFINNKTTQTGSKCGAVRITGGSSAFIISNTFYANTARNGAGALSIGSEMGEGRLFNNIFYKNYINTAPSDTGLMQVSSIIQSNNIFGNMPPHFLDESNPIGPDGIWGTNDDGLHLSRCNPYINTGDNTKNTIPKDIAGNNRIFEGIIDPGAYEQYTRSHIADTLKTTICINDSLLFNGVYYTTALTHTDSFFTVSGCDSFTTLILGVDTPVIPKVSSPLQYCIGAEVTALTATGVRATDTLIWYHAASGGIGSTTAPVPATNVLGTTNYYVSSRSAAGCESERKAITIHVFPQTLPALGLSPDNVLLCKGHHIMLYCTPVDAFYNYTWFKDGVEMGLPPGTTATPVGEAGIYQVRVADTAGCADRTINVSVSFYPTVVKPHINRMGTTLRLDHGYPQYQWYRNNKLIAGATAISCPLSFDGSYYAMVMDANGCTSVSDTITLNSLGMDETKVTGHDIRIYPNPTQNTVFVDAPEPINISVKDVTGRVVIALQNATQADLGNYADGMYLFYLTDGDNKSIGVEKVYKTSTR